MSDEVLIKVRLSEVNRAVQDAKRVEGAVGDIGDQVEKADKKSRLAAAAGGGLGMLGRTLGALARGAAVGVIGLSAAAVSIGTSVVPAASNLNETLSKTEQIFQRQAPAMKAWAATAAVSLGQSQDQALTAAGNYGNFFHNLGATEAAAAKMSKQLVITASDLASFNNTSPQEMLEAVSSALAGEFDPLQRYGFAISAAAVQQEALRMGLIRQKQPLTAAQQAQAAYSLILAQTGKAAGDFSRTSGGLANQQRILGAQWDNLKAKAGTALLPAVLDVAAGLNTHLLPALSDLVDQYGPQVSAWISDFAQNDAPRMIAWLRDAGETYGPRVVAFFRDFSLSLPDGASMADLRGIGGSIADIAGSLATAGGASTGGIADTVNVAAVAIGFLADHADTLAKAMPYLAAGIVLYKGAQGAANVAATVAVPLKVAEIIANRRLTTSNLALVASRGALTAATGVEAAAVAANTGVKQAGILATVRMRAAAVGSAIATKAIAVATGAWTAAQWLLNAAMSANPLGLVIIAIVAVIGLVVLLWKRSDTFRTAVQAVGRAGAAAFGWIWDKVSGLFGWLRKNWALVLAIITGPIGLAVRYIGQNLGKIKEAFKGLVNSIIGLWNGLDLTISIPRWVGSLPGVPDGVAGARVDLFPDIPMLARGGTATSGGLAITGENGPELLDLPAGASVVPLDSRITGGLRDALAPRIVQLVVDRRVLAEVALDGENDAKARL